MIDLTPLDVRKKRGDFSKGMRGYDPSEVDSFLDLVAERLEALVKENLTLRERSDRLGDQVRSQEGRERAVQEALVTAQELREDILGQARREADLMQREAEARVAEIRRGIDTDAERLKKEAQTEADRVLEEARTELDDLQTSIQELERRRVRFLKSFRSLLERELGDVEVEEKRAPMEVEAFEIDLHGARAPSWESQTRGLGAPRQVPDERPDEGRAVAQSEMAAGARNEHGAQQRGAELDAGPGGESPHRPATPEPVTPPEAGAVPMAGGTSAANAVDVGEVAPDAPAAQTRPTEGDQNTWTSTTLVYDDTEDDAHVRGA